MDNENKKLIATTRVDKDDFCYDDFVECYADLHGCPVEDVPSDDSYDYYRWCEEMTSDNWEVDCDEIMSRFGGPCVVTGTLGLWNGRMEIGGTRFPSLEKAFESMSEDMNDMEVYLNDGVMEVYGYHHDGINSFEVRPLIGDGDLDEMETGTYKNE